MGRAGRDGARAECVLLFAARDCPRLLNLIRRGSRSKFERGRAALQQARPAMHAAPNMTCTVCSAHA